MLVITRFVKWNPVVSRRLLTFLLIHLWPICGFHCIQPHTHVLNEHSLANLVCLSNGFVKNCLVSTHGECEQTSHWCWTNILWRSLNYRHPRKRYRMRTKAFTIAQSLLLNLLHIPILDERMRSFGIYVRHFKINQSERLLLISPKRNQPASVCHFWVTIPFYGLIITYFWHTCDVFVTDLWLTCDQFVTHLRAYGHTLATNLRSTWNQYVTLLWPYYYLLVTHV